MAVQAKQRTCPGKLKDKAVQVVQRTRLSRRIRGLGCPGKSEDQAVQVDKWMRLSR